MIAIVAVFVASLALAVVAYGMSARPGVHADPVDPTIEQRMVERAIRRRTALRAMVRRHFGRWSAGTVIVVSALVVLLSTAILVGLLLDILDELEGMAELDAWIAKWGAANASDASTNILEAITQLGARSTVLVALGVVAVVDYVRRRNHDVFAFVAIVGMGEMLIGNALKLLIHRERPNVLQLVDAGGYSFPSGHTSAAAAGWVAVALVLGRDRSRRVRALLSGGAVMVASAVATSRALLGVHWLTDVLAGLGVGWGWYLIVAIAFGVRRQRLGATVENSEPATPGRSRAKHVPAQQAADGRAAP